MNSLLSRSEYSTLRGGQGAPAPLLRRSERRVLYVSWTAQRHRPFLDPSVRYRCFNPAQALLRRGHGAMVVSQQEFEKNREDLADFDAYVFHRPLFSERLVDFVYGLDRDIAFADFDDLIFDHRLAGDTPMVRVRKSPIADVETYVQRTAAAAAIFRNFSVSTLPLKESVERAFGPASVGVVHNCPDPGFVALGTVARHTRLHDEREFELGYFSGTATHDLDFASIGDVVLDFLQESGHRLLLVGPLVLPPRFDRMADRIERLPLMPFHRLPDVMARCRRVLAPLEDSPFTRAKSGIKFFEAVLTGCDVLATPIPDVDRFSSPLLRKCRTADEWRAALGEPPVLASHEREQEICLLQEKFSIDRQLAPFFDFLQRG